MTGLIERFFVGAALALATTLFTSVAGAQSASPDFAYSQAYAFLLNPAAVDQLPDGSFDAKIKDAIQQVRSGTAQPGLVVSAITADGAASAIVVVREVGYGATPGSVTLTASNEASFIAYDANWRSTAPSGGSSTFSVPTQNLGISGCNGMSEDFCGYAILQAPDVLKTGSGGGRVALDQPIAISVTSPISNPNSSVTTVLPPAVLLVHGLWGNDASLAPTQAYLAGQGPWSTAGLLKNLQYDGSIAFDDAITQSDVDVAITAVIQQLSLNGIVAGRIDTVAHSMGGLVMRSFSGSGGYKNIQNRMLGGIHQIITLNTPEAGSKLASFLIANQNVPFSGVFTTASQFIVASKCGLNSTVGACVSTLEGPVNMGAVGSLQPNSANIARLPSPRIPTAVWNAFASTASQKNTISVLSGTTSGLVWAIDELVLATCPGASYCKTSAIKVPLVGNILGSSYNDGIVTLASQKAGCTSPCAVTTFTNLAHTGVPAAIAAITNSNNVQTSVAVQAKAACALLGNCTAAAAAAAEDTNAAFKPASAGEDPNFFPLTLVKAFPSSLPAGLALGQPFRLKVGFVLGRTKFVSVIQMNENGDRASQDSVPLETGSDGKTYAVVTPLVMGRVNFIFEAMFSMDLTSATSLKAPVGPPVTKPLHFWGDVNAGNSPGANGNTTVFARTKGLGGHLQPTFVWATAPTKHIVPHKGSTFALSSSADAEVIDLGLNGSFKCRKAGAATIVVGYAGLTTDQAIRCLDY